MANRRFVAILLVAVFAPSFATADSSFPRPSELGPLTTVPWQPTPAELADNYLWSGGGSNTNFGVSPDLMVGYWGNPEWNRAILRFPRFPLPANATLLAADLELYMHGADTPDAMAISVHRMTSPWTEEGSTWNDMDGSNAWNSSGGGGDFESTVVDVVPGVSDRAGWYSWNVTSLAAGWWNGSVANNGLLVRQSNDDLGISLGRKQFSSSDATNASARPRLLLTYRAPIVSLPGIEDVGLFPWILLPIALVPLGWILARRVRTPRFRATDLYLIHEDGRLVRHLGGSEGPVQDELAASGMFTLVAQFVHDSFGGGTGAAGELKSLTVDKRIVATAKGAFLFLALVFEGTAPADLDRRMAEFLDAIEGPWGRILRTWDGLRDGVAGLDAPLAWFLRTGYRRAHPRPPIPENLRRNSPG